eukprot:254727-Chlamydomonas_euryale.AAC.8
MTPAQACLCACALAGTAAIQLHCSNIALRLVAWLVNGMVPVRISSSVSEVGACAVGWPQPGPGSFLIHTSETSGARPGYM